jgi:hypothetical protein
VRHRVYYRPSAFDSLRDCGSGYSPYRQVDQLAQFCWIQCVISSAYRSLRLLSTSAFWDAGSMSQDLNGSAAIAVFNRGPMDGQKHSTEGDTAELCVVISDGQQHRYRRTEELQQLPDGRVAVVFDWAGRYYGSK